MNGTTGPRGLNGMIGSPAFLAGCVAGAGSAYLLDPRDGKRRRHVARDKIFHWSRLGGRLAWRKSLDLAHRVKGRIAENRAAFSVHEVPDDVLREHVRADMGHLVSHPRSVGVLVSDGSVTLTGPILSEEADRLVGCLERIPGVREVVNRLEPHETSERVSGLQGEGRRVPLGRRLSGPLIGLGLGATGVVLAAALIGSEKIGGEAIRSSGRGMLERAKSLRRNPDSGLSAGA